MRNKLILLFLLLFIFPILVSAKEYETAYTSVSVVNQTLETDTITIKNLTFVDNSNNSSLSFGFSGITINNSDSIVYYNATGSFYTEDGKLIYTKTLDLSAASGEGKFIYNINKNELGNYKVSDIVNYKLSINVRDSVINNNTPSTIERYKTRDYVIDKYEVIMNVNEDNTFDIVEKIEAYFNVQKHGIIRKIPLNNYVTRLDGTSYRNKAKITDVKVDAKYTTSKSNGKYSIKIGDANTYLKGKQDYEISYKYHLGSDKTNKYDELYFNIIGTEWDTVIGNVSFTINMPKNFDSSKLGFSRGTIGSTTNNGVVYNVKGNTITGQYNGILGVGEGLTVRCELEEGYFVIPTEFNWPLIITIVSLIIAGILWFIYGRNSLVIDTVEFYPPDNLNSLEIGRLYKGAANKKDVVSLLIYLASKGYIKIEEKHEKLVFSSYTIYTIYQIREYDGVNEQERKFMKNLFFYYSGREEVDGKQCLYVTPSDLRYKFYRTVNTIMDTVNTKDNKKLLFEKVTMVKAIMYLLLVVSIIATCYIVMNNMEGSSSLLPLLVICFYVPFLIGLFKSDGNIWSKTMIFCLLLIHGGIMFFGLFSSISYFVDIEQTKYILIGIACIVGIGIFIKNMKKRTDYGLKMLGRIKGFKNFLETAEKEKLEEMVEKNPTYFYDILPYTYVLGISNKWIKKFEDIAIPEPDWYSSPNAFNMYSFNRSFDNIMSSTSSAMTSTEVSNSSGGGWSSGGSSWGGSSGSSGGGSSGGGSGGGGGSSW